MRLLDRRGNDPPVDFAPPPRCVELERFVFNTMRPGPHDDVRPGIDQDVLVARRKPKAGELIWSYASADAADQVAIGEVVEQRRLSRETDRMMQRADGDGETNP